MKTKQAEYSRRWRERHPEAHKASRQRYNKKYAATDRAKAIVRASMRKHRGLPEPTRPEPTHCECCGQLPNGRGSLHLDHDHTTGKFRGWLCYRCNIGIGYLGDTVVGVATAVDYLIRSVNT